jgi:predicted permease
VTLALGIGAATSVYSVVEALFLRPLPYGNADRVVMVWEDASARGGNARSNVSGANFLDWRAENTSFEEMAAVRNTTRTLTSLAERRSPLVHAVTSNYFTLLGNRPLLGRTFAPGEDAGQGAPVTILSYATWQTAYGGDPQIVGKTVDLDDVPHEIIGVMPPSFHSVHVFPAQPAVWIPLPIETFRQERGIRRFIIFGRIKDGFSATEAQSRMSELAGALARRYPATNEKWGALLMPMREQLVGNVRAPMRLISAAVLSLLLIAGFNVICLLLALGSERVREMASRLALGASPSRIVRQLLFETGVLALAGMALGFFVSAAMTTSLVAMIPASRGIPFLDQVTHDGSVAAFAALCGCVITILCALLTARQSLRATASEVIRQAGRYPSEGRMERRLREGLIVGQVALSVMMLLAAGIMGQSLRNLTTFTVGFEPRNLLTVGTALRGPGYTQPEARTRFLRDVVTEMERLPAVVSASAASLIPPVSNDDSRVFSVGDGGARLEEGSAALIVVQPGYFQTMGIRVIGGRTNTDVDTSRSEPVLMISRELARRYFHDENPIGRTLLLDQGTAKVRREVIGIVDDVRSASPDPRPRPVIYVPHSQAATPDMAFVVRVGEGQPMPLQEVRRILLSADPLMPVIDPRPMESIVAEADWLARFVATLLALFTFVGLSLVAAGMYGVLAFVVSTRQREIGLRIALGARFSQIAGIVIGFAARVVGVGTMTGLFGFIATGTLLESLLFGVSRGDSGTYIGVFTVVVGITFIVCLPSLRRAARVNPMIVMKSE